MRHGLVQILCLRHFHHDGHVILLFSSSVGCSEVFRYCFICIFSWPKTTVAQNQIYVIPHVICFYVMFVFFSFFFFFKIFGQNIVLKEYLIISIQYSCCVGTSLNVQWFFNCISPTTVSRSLLLHNCIRSAGLLFYLSGVYFSTHPPQVFSLDNAINSVGLLSQYELTYCSQ